LSAHPREHEELLAALVCGERDAGEPEVALLLRTCAACRADWEGLRATAADLERAGAARREVLAGQAELAGAPGEERVLATLTGLAPRPPRRLVSRAVLLAAAAAVLLASWLVWRGLRGSAEREPVVLGPGDLALVSPRGPGADFSSFSWEYHGDAVAFELRVFALVDGRRGDECFPATRWRGTTWTTPPELLAALPPAIEWEVTAFDDLGLAAVASARASR
jgi:hypothetical protein